MAPGPVEPSPDFGPSPYQSPAILPDEEPELVWASDPIPAMPIVWPVAFALLASVFSWGSLYVLGNLYALSRQMEIFMPLAVIFGPCGIVGLFVYACIAYYSANPLVVSKSWVWKVLMVVLVPPVSMLVFVPTCVGSTVFLIPWTYLLGSRAWGIFVPVFLAYLVCAIIISRRMRWRFIKRDVESGYADSRSSTTGPLTAARD